MILLDRDEAKFEKVARTLGEKIVAYVVQFLEGIFKSFGGTK